ncbi:hypothetical protein AJ78_06272 [Emergomyces pasteurianus Ep9510]|uniref:Protein NO VEIN C-terminal domain-containing protein n=1 Tax=Emergomyces pasteurianus Ep9510 TaxID=1447872 RepID=A0A1J9PBB1_9EURO|nr:hypothetical protein AJ78_06272 [Emergomyces pasteurianus Ep9510]
MPPATTQISLSECRKLIESISDQHGYLGESVLSQMSPHVRRKVEEAMLKKDEMIGSSVITLSKNLYNSSARFVFELLQNADDNSYSKAKSLSAVPFVSFRVYPGRIVLECNEDGFTRENLIAICNVGKSSKSGAQGYIGEKGIGFKSVFMVAWKVHVQSGNFSFYFQHRVGDSGMGMISPIWEDPEELLDGPLTRITLLLHESGSDESLAKQRENTLQQFQELQGTFLLFMKNICRIETTIYDDHDQKISSTRFSMQACESNRVELKRETVEDGNTQEHTQNYHIVKKTVFGLPKSENRTYTKAELSTNAFTTAEIVLAFPLTHDSIPIIESQEIFAFLPIRNMGFPFLIQSDFVTDASRQDIVRSSARNTRILSAVASVFTTAVSQFCKHPTLRYQWMRYLPSSTALAGDKFWKQLLDGIYLRLKGTPSMWTKSLSNLHCIEHMRRVTSPFLDKNREPLFPDMVAEKYLASEYLVNDLDLLTHYGLREMNIQEFLDRVRQDLRKNRFSILRSPETDDDWHSRVATVLLGAIRVQPDTVKQMALIPLRGGEWISAKTIHTVPIYYSHAHKYPIPELPNLNLVDPRAENNPRRKQFLDVLGVKHAQVPIIRRKVIDCFSKYRFSRNDHAHAYRGIKLIDNFSSERVPQDHTFYFFDTDPYGAVKLLRPVGSGRHQVENPGLDVSFLHGDYMVATPIQPVEEIRTWKSWLGEMWHVREVIPLTRLDQLSEECIYVAKYHPQEFIGFLLKYWKFEGKKITESQNLTNELLKLEVVCENGDMYPLGGTYMRTAKLKFADRFLQKDEFFPWLKQQASLPDNPGLSELETVAKALGFGYPKSGLELYLDILSFIVEANYDANSLAESGRVFGLYLRIEARYQESHNLVKYGDVIRHVFLHISRLALAFSNFENRETFRTRSLIFVPHHNSEDKLWASPDSCLWEAPVGMRCKYPLKSRYDNIKDVKYATEFFQNTLAIPNAGIDDFLVELMSMRKALIDFDHIYDIYQRLYNAMPEMDRGTIAKVREQFEKYSLIYHESNNVSNWYRPDQCLWSTVTDIKGMVALNSLYDDLSSLFIKVLGVRTLTLEMVHDKLVEQGRGRASVDEIKETIRLLNSYLERGREHELPNPKRLTKSKVFPVKHLNGTVKLCSFATDFAIADRKHLLDLFSDKAKFLDFGVNDILGLEPFLRWVGLEPRYLSTSTKEISSLVGDSHRSLTSPDRNIALKAYGLLRIAVHCKSPRAMKDEQAFYELLKKIDVRETDGICSELHLNQDGNDIKVEVSGSELHFMEHEAGLTIYVPRDESTQYICFIDRIPGALLEFIMAEPSTGICEPFSEKALNAVHKVVEAQSEYVALILDRTGIISVGTPDDSGHAPVEIAPSSNEQSNIMQTPSQVNPDDSASDRMSSTLFEGFNASIDVLDMITTFSRAPRTHSRVVNHNDFIAEGTPARRVLLSPTPESADQTIDPAYGRLLDKVVTTARGTVFPSRVPSNMAALPHSNNESFRLRTTAKAERDEMIGAAGELFVFEVLSRLNPTLPGFSRDNWKSTIRHHATLHRDYTDLKPWNGRETADITYTDSDGVFTSLLIDKGYLHSEIWAGKRPEYYLEVKSTTSSWRTPFYMSRFQYEMMQKISHGESGSKNLDSVYVILRVFNLDQGLAGMQVYVDPNFMRERSELSFTAETWSVVPGARFGNPEG